MSELSKPVNGVRFHCDSVQGPDFKGGNQIRVEVDSPGLISIKYQPVTYAGLLADISPGICLQVELA